MKLGDVLRQIRSLLPDGEFAGEPELIVSHFLNISKSDLIFKTLEELSPDLISQINETAQRRKAGETLQYILGEQVFLNHTYRVTPSVLVPRPETEVLVQTVLDFLAKKSAPLMGLEIGLGSGAISLELLAATPGLKVFASEVSSPAIEIATLNAKSILGPDYSNRLKILKAQNPSEIFEPFMEYLTVGFDFLVSNPPYLDRKDEIASDVLKNEPALALFPHNPDPNYFYKALAQNSVFRLKSGGKCFLEIPHDRQKEIQTLFVDSGWNVNCLPDLTGRARVLIAEKES